MQERGTQLDACAGSAENAVILLVNIWGAKKGGMTNNSLKDMEDVQACVRVLEDSKSR